MSERRSRNTTTYITTTEEEYLWLKERLSVNKSFSVSRYGDQTLITSSHASMSDMDYLANSLHVFLFAFDGREHMVVGWADLGPTWCCGGAFAVGRKFGIEWIRDAAEEVAVRASIPRTLRTASRTDGEPS